MVQVSKIRVISNVVNYGWMTTYPNLTHTHIDLHHANKPLYNFYASTCWI